MEQQFALDLNNRCQFIKQDDVILFIIEIGIIRKYINIGSALLIQIQLILLGVRLHDWAVLEALKFINHTEAERNIYWFVIKIFFCKQKLEHSCRSEYPQS